MLRVKPLINGFLEREYLNKAGGVFWWFMLWFILIDGIEVQKRNLYFKNMINGWELGYVCAWIFLCDLDGCSPFAFSFVISEVVRHSGFEKFMV